jgi:hypothetical protein
LKKKLYGFSRKQKMYYHFYNNHSVYVGGDISVGIATRYGLGGLRIESWWGTRFSSPVQTSPEAHPAPYTMSTEPFLRVKRQVRGDEHLTPYSVEVKERVESYLSSNSGPSWPVLGRILPLPYLYHPLYSKLRKICSDGMLQTYITKFYGKIKSGLANVSILVTLSNILLRR